VSGFFEMISKMANGGGVSQNHTPTYFTSLFCENSQIVRIIKLFRFMGMEVLKKGG